MTNYQVTLLPTCTERHLQLMFKEVPEGVLWSNLEQRITHANPQAASMVGLPHDDLVSLDVTEVFPEVYREKVQGRLAALYGAPPRQEHWQEQFLLNGRKVSLYFIPVKHRGHRTCVVILSDTAMGKRLSSKIVSRLRLLNSMVNIGLV